MHVIKHRPGQWYISRAGMILNHTTGRWHTDYQYRHSHKRPYLTARDNAIRRAQVLIDQLRDAGLPGPE